MFHVMLVTGILWWGGGGVDPRNTMVQWKMGPFNIRVLSFRVIFHFHDYGRKGGFQGTYIHFTDSMNKAG